MIDPTARFSRRRVVVAGSDTGIGKTWVARSLARTATIAGMRVVAIKPVETGCADESDTNEDGVLLAEATGQAAPRRALLRFRAPVAPPEAADREGRAIDYDALLRGIREHEDGADLVLIEGAGGLLAPLTWEKSPVDLALDLGAVVLLVASDRLGTINHVRLTLNHLATVGAQVLGVVLTPPAQPDASTGSNASAIERLTNVRVHGVPRDDDPLSTTASMQPILSWIG